MVQLNSFFFVILILKQVDHFFSVQQEIPKNDIQPQQQPSLLSQDLPEGKLAAIEIQHESDKNPAGRTENTIDDELEIDGVNAVHQTNDLNEMINQIKKVENFHEQLELNNELSAGEGNPDSSKEMVSSTTIFTTIETNAKSNFPEIPLPETINQNISLLEKEVEFLNQINTANMNMFKNKSSNNNLDEKNLNYIISKPKEVIQLKLNLNLSRNKSDIKNDIILNHSIHYENRAVNKHDDHNSLKIKEKLPNSSKENESKELNEESIRVEELSLWEKILLGIRCARQDCRQDAFIIEEQDEKLNQQRLIKGWKITRRARRIFTCPCKNILL